MTATPFLLRDSCFDCVEHNKLWKILKEMGIPDHLTCLLRNLHAGQEATVRTGHGTTDWFQIGKGVRQGCHPAYLSYMQSTSLEMLGWMKHKLESRLLGDNLRYADDTTLMAESKERLKSLLMKVKEESDKSWLKAQHLENKDHGIRSHHFMAKGWRNSGNSGRLYFWGAPKSVQMVAAAMK